MSRLGLAVVLVLGAAACSKGTPGVTAMPPTTAGVLDSSTTASSRDATTTSLPPPVSTAPLAVVPARPTIATLPPATAPRMTTVPPPSSPAIYVFPVAGGSGGYARTHHDYPASDVFAGCGASIVSAVDGRLLEVRREDAWRADVDNPAARGGRSVTVLGDDGVRYYYAHFASVADGLSPTMSVAAGQVLGTMGQTGRASACHLHFGISPPCPGKEWSVRRGVVWPWPYLDSWMAGGSLSPADEVRRWSSEHPGACAEAMADPDAPLA